MISSKSFGGPIRIVIGIAILAVVIILIAYGYNLLRLYLAFQNIPDKSPRIHTCNAGEIELQVWINPGWINPGESVTLRFTITNTGTETFTREKPDGPVLDLVVPTNYSEENPERGSPSHLIVRWSDTLSAAQVPHRLELKGGESHTIELVYSPKVYQGQETAEGRVWARTDYDKCPNFVSIGNVLK